jgi:DNA-binding GntR family transcriptional regulator
LGVSRGPIGEAFTSLERGGLVVTTYTGRTYVSRLFQKDLDEVFGLRRALERLAIEYACQHAASEDIARAEAIVEQMAAAIERGITAKEGVELDLAFHDAIFKAARHQRLLDYWNTLRPQVYVFLLSRNVASPDLSAFVVKVHRDIRNALETRDWRRSVDLVDGYMEHAYRLLSHTCGVPTDAGKASASDRPGGQADGGTAP